MSLSNFSYRCCAARFVFALLFFPPIQANAEAPDKDTAESAKPETVIALGGGAAGMAKWLGSANSKTQALPYLDINWRDRIEFSSTDGLTADLLNRAPWHGGLVGTMMWGRSSKDLGALAAAVPTLNNTVQGGLYLEYEVVKALTVGLRWRHDFQSTGAAYADAYAELVLPAPGPIEHSLRVNVAQMNESAMQRYFGLSQASATALGVSAYQAGAGLEATSLSYQAFVPTSLSTGFALGASWGKLASHASDSPLVRNFGSKIQRGYLAAFTVHF